MSLTFKKPKKSCNDKNCPFHGTLSVRGRVFEGVVATSKIPSHNPPCINAKEGQQVKIVECRPLSKTVSFVIVEKLETK